jgi:magnesium-transporting ATPase (P-type)
MPCDAVLLRGTAVVNEAMLSGESIPVIKAPITPSQTIYDPSQLDKIKKYTLFCGTLPIQTRSERGDPKALAIVTRTGFTTNKGILVRDILCIDQKHSKFYKDAIKYVALMAVIGIIGFLASIKILLDRNWTGG